MKTYSVAEVCEMLGCVNERWVMKRVRNGTFPARKVGRDVRFTEGDIAGIFDACVYKPNVADVLDSFMPELSARSKRAS